MSGVYYPQVACRFMLRFDEALLAAPLPDPESPQDRAESLAGGLGALAGALGGLAAASDSGKRVGLMDGTGDRLTHIFSIIPTSASVEVPSFRLAPKFSLTFAFKDFPIDPRAIRAAGVDIYIATVKASEFSDGMLGRLRGDGRLASQLTLDDKSLMLAGLVDSITTEFNERGSEVRMDGRGFQGMFLDKKISSDTLKNLNLNQPLDQVVRDLLDSIPQGKKIPLAPVRTDWPGGVLPSPAVPEILARPNKGRDGQSTQVPTESDPNQIAVWDLITKLCFLVGAVPYFKAHQLILRTARGIYDQKDSGPTPFKGGAPRSVETKGGAINVRFRKMVYGRNLLTFKLERKFQGNVVPTVRVVCVDTNAKTKGADRLLTVEWPKQGETDARRTRINPNGTEAATDFLNIPVKGVTDKTRLLEIARQVYEEVGRGEVGGSASSKDLASLGGDNGDTDLITLRPGDAVEFLVDAAGLASVPPVASELTNQATRADQDIVQDLQQRLGMSADLAKVLVGTSRGRFQGLQNVFRVGNVKYSWDLRSGIGVDFDFQNYIVARADVEGGTVGGETDFSLIANENQGVA